MRSRDAGEWRTHAPDPTRARQAPAPPGRASSRRSGSRAALRLNYPEAVALIATQLLELIRDGRARRRADGPRAARILGRRQVMAGVPELVDEVQVEGTFPDGTKLVTVHHPIVARARRPRARALRQLPARCPLAHVRGRRARAPAIARRDRCRRRRDRAQRRARRRSTLAVTNRGDRPIQVGSHYHFVETNRALDFDRARGRRACASTSPPAPPCASSRARRTRCSSSIAGAAGAATLASGRRRRASSASSCARGGR